MRFNGIALLASVVVLGACGGENKPADTAAANAAASATTPAATPAATPAPAGAVTAMPATGTTHEVKMVGDATGYKYEPANITIKAGDAIKFINVSGGPHNVAFQNVMDAAAKAQLIANMPGVPMMELSSPMITQPNEAYTISFAGVPAGKYDFNCTPHLAMNMKGVVTIQ